MTDVHMTNSISIPFQYLHGTVSHEYEMLLV